MTSGLTSTEIPVNNQEYVSNTSETTQLEQKIDNANLEPNTKPEKKKNKRKDKRCKRKKRKKSGFSYKDFIKQATTGTPIDVKIKNHRNKILQNTGHGNFEKVSKI